MRKFIEAEATGSPEVVSWGTGSPAGSFLHVDELADAALYLMAHYDSPEFVNVGTGEDLTIQELAEMIGRRVIGAIPRSTYRNPMERPESSWMMFRALPGWHGMRAFRLGAGWRIRLVGIRPAASSRRKPVRSL